jgi:hypothetical protein
MRTATQWLDDYGDSHRNRTNKILHWICVPVIAWCVLGFLWSLPFPSTIRALHPLANWGSIAVGLALLYYAALSVPPGVGRPAFPARRSVVSRSARSCRRRTAVEHLPILVRGCMDRPVHRPRRRRQAPVVLQGCSVPDDWAAVAAGRCVSAAGDSVLGRPGPTTSLSHPGSCGLMRVSRRLRDVKLSHNVHAGVNPRG